VDLVQAFFGGICTFTLFKNSVQELICVAGDPDVISAVGLYPGKRLLPETSLCGHSVLRPGTDLYVQNLAQHWIYKGNPYSDPLRGVKSYLGSAISLNVDPSSADEKRVVGIGVINCMHLDDFLPPLNAGQKKVMGQVATILQTQLRATWEGLGRTKEARARRAVADFLEDTLVPEESYLPPKSPQSAASDRTADPPRRSSEPPLTPLITCARNAVKQILAIAEDVDSVAIVDLTSFHLLVSSSIVLWVRQYTDPLL
jgi:hypothetical protein